MIIGGKTEVLEETRFMWYLTHLKPNMECLGTELDLRCERPAANL
jgi:hypothetical protein